MKKKEIMKLIRANATIAKNDELLTSIVDDIYVNKREPIEKEYFADIPGLYNSINPNGYKDVANWLPNIPELGEQFEQLKKELVAAKKETLQAVQDIKATKCQHEVCVKIGGQFGTSNYCVLCGHRENDKPADFKDFLSNGNNKVMLPYKYDDNGDEICQQENGKTFAEIRMIIAEILKKYADDDEVDLVQEVEKLKLMGLEINNSTVNTDNYILIIGGTNLSYINRERKAFITSNYQTESFEFFQYFAGMLNYRTMYVEQKENLDSKIRSNMTYKSPWTNVCSYTTIDSLEKMLKNNGDIPFKLIIDMTHLYDYKISDNAIIKSDYNLHLERKYPNSCLVTIKNLDYKESLKQIKKQLIDYKQNKSNVIFHGKDYYYLADNSFCCDDLNGSCSYLKKMIRDN